MVKEQCFVYPDDVVSFNYNGGSNPGEKRLVEILTITDDYWKGWDFKRGGLRTFIPSKLSNLRHVDEDCIKEVDLFDLPSSVSPNKLVEGFEQDGYLVHQTDDEIVAVKEKNVPTSLIRGANYIKIGDITLLFNSYHSDSVDIDTPDDYIYNATVDDLVGVMTKMGIL